MRRRTGLASVIACAGLLVACGTRVPGASTDAVSDPALADRLGEVEADSLERTGGSGPEERRTDPPGAQIGPAGSAPVSSPAGGSVAVPAVAEGAPLRIGVLYVNNDAAASAGVDNENTFGPRVVIDALIEATNDAGGLAGRPLDASFYELRSSASSYATELQAACSQFVQDDNVELALSFLGTVDEQFSACLADAGVAQISGDYALGDAVVLQAAPSQIAPLTMTADRRAEVVLRRMAAEGFLTADKPVGVLVEGCPYNERTLERTVRPVADALGLTLVDRSTRCFAGIGDLGALASDSQAAVLAFRAEGVDRVMFVSAVEGNLMLFFATAAESQGYRPGYALSTLAIPVVQQANTPHAQLSGARGVGWIPALDDSEPASTAEGAACLDTLASHGVPDAASGADHFYAFSACDAFDLAEQLLLGTDGVTAPAPLLDALSGLATSFRSAAVLDGATSFEAARRDGAARARTFAWDVDCSCFRYTGDRYAI